MKELFEQYINRLLNETPILVGKQPNGYEDILYRGFSVSSEHNLKINKRKSIEAGYKDLEVYQSLKHYFKATNNDFVFVNSNGVPEGSMDVFLLHEDMLYDEEAHQEIGYDGEDSYSEMTALQSVLDKHAITDWNGYVMDDVSKDIKPIRIGELKEPYLTSKMLQIFEDNGVIDIDVVNQI